MTEPLLLVEDLTVHIDTPEGTVHAVNGLGYTVGRSEVVAVVGESGSGKSISSMALLGLLPANARVVAGTARFQDRDLLALRGRERRRVRGRDVGVVFQDATAALNPVLTVGRQLREAIRWHRSTSRARADVIAAEALTLVGLDRPAELLGRYPHELSGGMRQRVGIAVATVNRPALVIADEPTTALDVSLQAKVLDLLLSIRDETGSSILFITHDLGVVAEIADRVLVVYGGRVVESGPVDAIFDDPQHAYTAQLLASRPGAGERLSPIPGSPPTLLTLADGCEFRPRCRVGVDREPCGSLRPELEPRAPGHASACHWPRLVRGEEITHDADPAA